MGIRALKSGLSDLAHRAGAWAADNRVSACIAGGGLVLLTAGVVVVSVWAAGPSVEPLPDKPANELAEAELARVFASPKWSAMSKEQKQPYLDRFRQIRQEAGGGRPFQSLELSEQQRDAIRRNLGEDRRWEFQARIDAFFELAPDQRDAYLDQLIDERMNRPRPERPRPERTERTPPERDSSREAPGSDGDGEGPRRGGRGRGFSPERMKQRIEGTDPEQRAKFQEFFKALRKRMEERGIEGPRRGPQ